MIVDARSISSDEVIETDLCVIGGGVAGLTLARELDGAGMRVALLESGGMEVEEDARFLNWGENVGYPYYPLNIARGRQVGGTSHCWSIDIGDGRVGVRIRPLDAVDFEEREGIPHSGWPFDKAHLDPYYERAQELFNLGRYTYRAEDWADAQTPTLPLDEETVRSVVFSFPERDPFTDGYKTWIRASDTISLLIHANVLEIVTDDAGSTVEGVHVASRYGGSFAVRAGQYVLAAGGIENPRLLLASNKASPRGIGNEHDLVGRFFMEHPHFLSGKLIPNDDTWFDRVGFYRKHEVGGVHVLGYLALAEEVVRREGLLNFSASIWPTTTLDEPSRRNLLTTKGFDAVLALRSALLRREMPQRLGRHVRHMVSDVDQLTAFALQKAGVSKIGKVFQKNGDAAPVAFQLHNMTEQVPNPDSRVLLSDDRDAFGQPRVKLDWRLTAFDVESIRRAHQLLDGALRRAGVGRLQIEDYDDMPPEGITGGYHHMGTTRMHREARSGVVDAQCRVHGVSNLFVAGSSVFPTGGFANPTFTIVALAIRLADHLKALAVS